MKKRTPQAFLFHFNSEQNPTKAVWYAGLGVPFKLTTDFQFAKSVDFDTVSTSMLIKQLEKHYGKTFHQITLKDAMPSSDFRCASCGLGWTQTELDACAEILFPETVPSLVEKGLKTLRLPQTHLASQLRTKDSLSFAKKIKPARYCGGCTSFLCGSCAPPRRSRDADKGLCVKCKPARRRA